MKNQLLFFKSLGQSSVWCAYEPQAGIGLCYFKKGQGKSHEFLRRLELLGEFFSG